MGAHKLNHEKAALLLEDYAQGVANKELASKYGITKDAVSYWLPYVGLDFHWLQHVKTLEFKFKWLDRRNQHAVNQLRMSVEVIKNLIPSRKKRSLMSATLRAQYGLDRSSANAIFGLQHSAGGSVAKTRIADSKLVEVMKKYLSENPGDGFERMFKAVLEQSSCVKYQVTKLYQENKLGVQHRKKKVPMPIRIKNPMRMQVKEDQVWSIDFMTDVLPNGNRFWILNVVDDFSRECVLSQVTRRATAQGLVAALEKLRVMGRKAGRLRSDNGGQFKSFAYSTWADRNNVGRIYIRPFTSCDNAFVERFNGSLRQEVTDRFTFSSLQEAQSMIDDWRIRYNVSRPHIGLGGLSPMQFSYAESLKRGVAYRPCFL